ncbi:Hsp20/alpha crystallin family protein [Aquibacillus koreensis]|uniref:Hsp20/alpha crystallin family protein n=1 Tax=Aquibacillus koreensis TaxID=279446 RepID=A0A9X4AJY5_9BACI|nr:Hsp20/alpha crystallin family protein [Aquibacillus koreensis]MCT2538223.1 Hsp20/alpha crystallin family protein [Aquibacillus koreensis]MDC3420833.1 Hsp20/alpha crystallin family protein [Aquibacillus koreensis]
MDEKSKHHKKKQENEAGSDLMRMMDDFFSSKPTKNILNSIDSFFYNSSSPTRIPVDVFETDNEWVVKVDLPGLRKEDIHVDVVGDRLKIKIADDQELEKYDEKSEYYHRERRYRKSERTVHLPYTVDKKTAKAKYANGVLDIRGPKKPRSDHQLDID